jgi:hypothetical protein
MLSKVEVVQYDSQPKLLFSPNPTSHVIAMSDQKQTLENIATSDQMVLLQQELAQATSKGAQTWGKNGAINSQPMVTSKIADVEKRMRFRSESNDWPKLVATIMRVMRPTPSFNNLYNW